VFLRLERSACHIVCSSASRAQNVDVLLFMLGESPMRILEKVRWDTLLRTCVFASGAIYDSRSKFGCIRGMKRRHTIFHA
jgi:hypothetical protein